MLMAGFTEFSFLCWYSSALQERIILDSYSQNKNCCESWEILGVLTASGGEAAWVGAAQGVISNTDVTNEQGKFGTAGR